MGDEQRWQRQANPARRREPGWAVLEIIPWVGAEWPGKWDVSPDGTQLAFTAFNSETPEHLDEYPANIYLLDVATGDLRFLVDGWVLAWSPDGKQIACIREYNLWVIDATTGQGKKILDIERGYAAENVAWAPDGDRIAVQYKVASEGGSPELLVIGIGESESVTQVIIPRTWWSMWGAAWLPDRERIIYVLPEREPTAQSFDNLWVVDAETRVSTPLTARVNVSSFSLSLG